MADVVVAVNIAGSQTVSPAAQQAASSLGSLESAARNATSGLDSLSSSLARGAELAAGFLIFDRIRDAFNFLGDAAIGLSGKLQTTSVAFEVMTGSAELAAGFLRQLAQFAADTPFEFPDVIQGAQRLKAMGFQMNELIPLMTDIGNVASAFGGNIQDNFTRVVTAIGQMQAKTKVQTEELRQLTEVGVPAWKILADAAHLPIPVMQELVHSGQVASDFFIKAFDEWSRSNFGDMMSRQMHTFDGAVTTVRDNLRLAISDAFNPFFQMLSAGMVTLAEFTRTPVFNQWVGIISGAMLAASNAVQSFLTGLAPVGDAIGKIFEQFAQGNVSGALSLLGESLGSALKIMLDTALAFGDSMFGAGTNLMSELAGGIIEGAGQLVTQAVNFVADLIASFLIGQSPPPMGPLSLIHDGGMGIIIEYGAGIREGAQEAANAALDVATQVATPLIEAGKQLDLAFTLEQGREGLAGAAGDLKALTALAHDVDGSVRLIDDAMRDLERTASDVKMQITDIKDAFEEQLDVLKDQVDAVKDRFDEAGRARDQKKMEMELEELGLKQAENAAQGNKEVIAGIKAQQTALKFKSQEVSIAEQMESLAKQEKDGKDVGAKRELLGIRAQELNLAKQLADQSDKEALARIATQKDILKGAQDELGIEERRAKIQESLELQPLENAIKDVKKEQEAALAPLEEQIRSIDRQKMALTRQRDVWRDLQEDIKLATTLVREFEAEQRKQEAEAKKAEAEAKAGAKAAKTTDPIAKAMEKAGQTRAINTGGAPRLPTVDITGINAQVAQAARDQGQAMADDIGLGMQDWFHAHLAAIITGAIGFAVFGPIGAAIGAALGEGIIQRFKELGIEDQVAEGFGRLVVKIQGFGTQLLNIFATIGQVIKGDWSDSPEIDNFSRAAGNIAVVFRDQVLPAIQTVGNFLASNLWPTIQTVFSFLAANVGIIVGIGAAFATWVVLGTLVTVFTTIAGTFATLGTIIGVVATNFALMGAVIAAGGSAFSVLGTILGVVVGILGGPVVIAIAAIAIAVGVLTAAWINNWGDIQGKTAAVVSWVQGVPGMLSNAWDTIKSGWDTLSNFAGQLWNGITTTIGNAVRAVGTAISSGMSTISSVWSSVWGTISSFVSNLWNGTIVPFFNTTMAFLGNVFLVALGAWYVLFAEKWVALFNYTVEIWTRLSTWFMETLWTPLTTWLTTKLTEWFTAISTAWTNITTFTQTVWTAISTWFMETLWTPLTGFVIQTLMDWFTIISTAWTNITTNTQTLWNAIVTYFVDTIWTPLTTLFTEKTAEVQKTTTDVWNEIKRITDEVWNGISSFLTTLWETIGREAERLWNAVEEKVLNPVKDAAKQMKGIGEDLINNFFEGLKNKGEEVLDWVKGFVDKIKEAFKGAKGLDEDSPSKEMFDVGFNAMEGLNLGLQSRMDAVMNTVQKTTAGITSGFAVSVPGSVRDWIAQAAAIGGFPESWIAPMSQLAVLESGGNPNISNAAGSGATGLVQMMPGTFASYAIPGHGNILNPVDNAIASMRYIADRGGKGAFWLGDPWNVLQNWERLGGYDKGGILPEDMTAFGRKGSYQLHGGEGIFNQDQMKALGLSQKMYYNQQALLDRMEQQGGSGATVVYESHYHFHGSIMTEKDATRAVRKHMINTGLSNVDIFPGLAQR